MSYYNTCPKCGATLDPGESCDCESKEKPVRQKPVLMGKRAVRKGMRRYAS